MKKGLLRELATSYTTLLFLVIAISGVMMYFKFFDMYVKSLHEILGLVFVVAAIFHVIVNWKAMKNYFFKKVFVSASIITVIVSGIFAMNAGGGTSPKSLILQKVINAPLDDSFKVLNINPQDAIDKLKAEKIIYSNEKTIIEIAKVNKTSPFRIVNIVLK